MGLVDLLAHRGLGNGVMFGSMTSNHRIASKNSLAWTESSCGCLGWSQGKAIGKSQYHTLPRI